jgi:hypothetical protein
MTKTRSSLRLALAATAALGAAGADAAIYKCSLPGGNTEYRSTPCVSGTTGPLNIQEVPPEEAEAASPPRTGNQVPEIVGSGRFYDRVIEALALLETKDATAYSMVLGYIGRVEPGGRSGMQPLAKPPTMYLSADALISATWVAGVFAHESFHSKLYFDYQGAHPGSVPRRVYGGTQAEIKCTRHAIAVMRRLGAPQSEIDQLLIYADGHHVNDWEYE